MSLPDDEKRTTAGTSHAEALPAPGTASAESEVQATSPHAEYVASAPAETSETAQQTGSSGEPGEGEATASAGSGPRVSPLLSPELLGIVLAMAALIAFGTALGGQPIWDDEHVLGVAARLTSPWRAFTSDLFGLGSAADAGAGASYYRPLVTMAYSLEMRLFSRAPAFGMHLASLVWHAASALLVARALLRWITPSARAEEDGVRPTVAAYLAAFAWAVVPAKAENVAWIAGRADPMGLALLLGALALGRDRARTAERAALAALGTALALGCKEAFVVAPVIVALDRASAMAPGERKLASAWSPETLASAAVAGLYLLLRAKFLPIHGGGSAMFAGLSVGDRASLVLESAGHAFRSLVVFWDAHVLRGPIGFAAPFVLRRDPGMAGVGAAGLLALVFVALRAPRLRGAAALIGLTLLPTINLIPSGLESRMSDRFLYVPSLGAAIMIAVGLTQIAPRRFASVAACVALLAVVAGGIANRRSVLFGSADALWRWERQHGERAASVLQNAANVTEHAGRFDEARAGFLETADRYQELGFDESFPFVMRAVSAQMRATGEADEPAYAAYRRLLQALVRGESATIVIPSRVQPISIQAGSPSARDFATRHVRELSMRLLVLRARDGDETTAAEARALVDGCPRCSAVVRGAAQVELALEHPAVAHGYLQQIMGLDSVLELAETAALQAATLAQPNARIEPNVKRAEALFLAEAFSRSCALGAPRLISTSAPSQRRVIGAACLLAGQGEAWKALRSAFGADADALESQASALRNAPPARGALVEATLGQ